MVLVKVGLFNAEGFSWSLACRMYAVPRSDPAGVRPNNRIASCNPGGLVYNGVALDEPSKCVL